MVEKDSENFYSKYLRISLPFLVLIFLSFSVFALTTTDKNYSSGVYNGGFEFAPTYVADTNVNGRWVDGTASGSLTNSNFGWYVTGTASGGFAVDFNSIIKKSGNYSMELRNNGTNVQVRSLTDSSTLRFNNNFNLTRIKPNTKYKLSGWIKSESASSNACYFQFPQRTILNNTATGTVSSSKIGGTTDWTYLTIDLTSNANSYYTFSILYNDYSDSNGSCFFDDVRLEEVGLVSLSGQSQGRPSIVVTGVSDFNAIDQAQTTSSYDQSLGTGNKTKFAQQIIPTKKIIGFTWRKGRINNDFNQNVNLYITDDNSGPSENKLFNKTYTKDEWNLLQENTDICEIVDLNSFDYNGTNSIWIVWSVDNNYSDSNTSIMRNTGAGYSLGLCKEFNPITNSWGNVGADAYFKTLFEKQSSSFDLNVCSSGDSVCESKTYDIDFLENGENYIINPADAPLFYEGDNNVYFMMHSDSDYNNKTPSMMAKLTYTFDKPTTLLTNTPSTEDNKRIITLTCQNATTGNCNNTYYSTDGINYTTYTTPLTLTLGTTTLKYYSTADNNNTETINTTNITIPAQNGTTTCSLISIIPLLIVLVSIMLILGGGAMMTDQAPAAIIQIILLMVTILITVYVLITSTCFL